MQASASHQSARNGFTLIELLITVAIIAILASLLLPALASAKYNGKNARCKSNLRQIDIAIKLYIATHNVFPPTYDGFVDPLRQLVEPYAWETKLELDLRTVVVRNPNPPANNPPTKYDLEFPVLGGVFRCPLNDGYRYGSGWLQIHQNCYGYNASGIGGGGNNLGLGGTRWNKLNVWGTFNPMPESDVVQPSEMIELGDIFRRSRSAQFDAVQPSGLLGVRIGPWGAGFIPEPQKIKPKDQRTFKLHHGRANRAFVDGHIESENLRPQFRATDAELRRWNADHRPHREMLQD